MFSTRGRARSSQVIGRARRGLTLVEMLVAMALTLMIVFAIVQMFQWVGERTTTSRAVLELAGQIRAASNLLQQDLSNHTAQALPYNRDATSGYIELSEFQPKKDSDLAKTNSVFGDVDDVIALTVCSKDVPYSGKLNGTTYTSSLAEVVWWVVTDSDGNNNLYRRVLLIRPDLNVTAAGASNLQDFYNANDISVRLTGSGLAANSLEDLSTRQNRFAHNGDAVGESGPYILNMNKLRGRVRSGTYVGNDVVLSKMAAFDMRVYDPAAIVYGTSTSATVCLTPVDPGYKSADAVALLSSGSSSSGSGPSAPPSPIIADNGGGSFVTSGFTSASGEGYSGSIHYAAAGSGSSTATWTFTGLTPGTYRVSATWTAVPNRATNAPYTVLDGSTNLGTFPVNQELTPADFSDAGVGWKDLGTALTVNSGTLVVRLTNNANEYVIADAIRILQNVATPPSTVAVGAGEGAYVDLAYSPNTFRYKGPSTVTPPAAPPPIGPKIADGGSDFSTSGFSPASGEGLGGSIYYAAAGTGSATATWTFGGLPAGKYKVWATWSASGNRASNAPYTIYDGGAAQGTVPVNQTLTPSGISDGGANWTQLGVFTVSSGTMSVRLTNSANNFVIADGVRIDWDSSLTPPPTVTIVPYEVPLSYFSGSPHAKSGFPDPTWETTPYALESNGIDDDGDGVIDNGLGNGISNTDPKRDAYSPYPYPVRGISVLIRGYEPHSRQVLQRSVVESFVAF